MEFEKEDSMNIFLICPVRHATEEETAKIQAYVDDLESKGNNVYWPARDTNQTMQELHICNANAGNIVHFAHEVHIWWNGKSEGSLFDLGMVFMIQYLCPIAKKIILANKEDIKETEFKSFNNLLRTMGNGHRRV
jgi:hypothetical protein